MSRTRRDKGADFRKGMKRNADPVERFWRLSERDPSTGCWVWLGTIRNTGYGSFYMNGKKVGAHRFAYKWFIGGIPEGMHVCHHCDNKACVNPAHLFAGSHRDNMIDMSLKGRGTLNRIDRTGERNGRSKLSPADVRDIRSALASGEKGAVVARRFGVGTSTVYDIRDRRKWNHVG